MSAFYRRFASAAAVSAAGVGLAYSISFVLITRASAPLGVGLSAIFLMLGGLLTVSVAVALYQLLQGTDSGFALFALLLSAVAGLGAAIHGAHDLAVALHPPAGMATDLPSEVDPRGFLTFGLAGLAVFLFSWLILRSGSLRPGLGYLGYLSAALLTVIYLARLIILTPSNPVVLLPAALEGFIVNPAWYLLIGLALRRPA